MSEQRREYAVQELLELAHRFKALRIKTGPIEIEISPGAFGPVAAPEPGGVLDLDDEPVPTPEDFMFMAGLQVEKAGDSEAES